MSHHIILISPLIIFISLLITGCKDQVDSCLEFAEDNRSELEQVLRHYENDKQKLHAARFLIENMSNKHYYIGKQQEQYDILFQLYDSLCQQGNFASDPSVIKQAMNSLKRTAGTLSPKNLNQILDCRHLTAGFLIDNIDHAFEAWQAAPEYISKDFETFCEFILPYRTGTEIPETYRGRYYKEYKILRDTATNDSTSLLSNFKQELYWNRNYRQSQLMWDYPLDISISQMERGRKGACRHSCAFYTATMRACGIPVAIDHVPIWGNRDQGHSWCVLIRKDGTIFPFNPFEDKRAEFPYKPAKIFRRMYSNNWLPKDAPTSEDAPPKILQPNELDVTHLYGKTFDISVFCDYPYTGQETKKYGVICVFDNKKWRPVFWGRCKNGQMHFKNMMGDICYMAAYYDKGEIIPAGVPFILEKDGTIRKLTIKHDQRTNMTLLRKYPAFARMELFAKKLVRSTVEGADHKEFKNPVQLMEVAQPPLDVNDSIINQPRKFRYVRWKIVNHRTGDLAEVEFYGKKSLDSPEEKLQGNIIGLPEPTKKDNHSFLAAMDGDPATYFVKKKDVPGYVGLDLGKGNEAYITRVHFHPRSDTNYILIGDTYKLCYWDNNRWVSAGIQKATTHELTFKDVPQGTFYILHNLTKGKEERIFTYENGKQVWW